MNRNKALRFLKGGSEGIAEWNQLREEGEEIPRLAEVDLAGADLRKVDLSGANIAEVDFSGAILSEANLSGANLIRANLTTASLGGANLSNANLSKAALHSADLTGASLRYAVMSMCGLKGTVLADAHFGRTEIDSDIGETIGLDLAQCHGPSTLSIQTLLSFRNDIPENFLRGCGLQDWVIEIAKLGKPDINANQVTDILYRVSDLRTGQLIQMHNLFISYSHLDSQFVEHIEGCLNDRRIRYWRDVHDAPSGPLEDIVFRAIRQNPTVLLILSKHSVVSDWVELEIQHARAMEKKLNRHVLCPIALDESWKDSQWPKVLMNQVKKYNILDFSAWRDATAFEDRFDRLLAGLDLFYWEPEEWRSLP